MVTNDDPNPKFDLAQEHIVRLLEWGLNNISKLLELDASRIWERRSEMGDAIRCHGGCGALAGLSAP